jgi:Ankyrin repeats (3 copies)
MKLVKEILYEKFTTDSDPIKDMGIGTDALLDKWLHSSYRNYADRLSYKENINCIMNQCVTRNKPIFVEYLLRKYNKRFDLKYKKLILKYADENKFNEVSEIVKKYIRKNKNVNEKFTDESDPIKDLGIGVKELIKRYIKKEFNIDEYSIQNYLFGGSVGYNGILAMLAKEGKIEIIPYLLQIKEVNPSDNHSFALRWAAATGRLDIVKLLLKHGADINGYAAGSALTCALYHDEINVIKYLISLGARVTTEDIDRAERFLKDDFTTEKLKKLYNEQNKK